MFKYFSILMSFVYTIFSSYFYGKYGDNLYLLAVVMGLLGVGMSLVLFIPIKQVKGVRE